MSEEVKATEAPVEESAQPKASDGGTLIEKRRAEIEKIVEEKNREVPEPEPEDAPETPEVEEKSEEPVKEPEPEPEPEADPLERIKKSVQKRIDKVVAQKKTLEEELADTKAELERLKHGETKQPSEKTDDKPTVEQVEAYIVRMREEGNTREEIAATRYLISLEKETALKELRETQEKKQKESEQIKQKQLAEWADLCRDYAAYDDSGKIDESSELSLKNQNGLLYKTALGLYNDKELHADYYNDPDSIRGFRRAVADAYREIHQQGLIKTPKGEKVEAPRNPREVLADPSADAVEETAPKNSLPLSDAEKVREEIKARKKNRFIRKIS